MHTYEWDLITPKEVILILKEQNNQKVLLPLQNLWIVIIFVNCQLIMILL